MGLFITLAILVIIAIAAVANSSSKTRKLAQLQLAYQQALKGNNKKTALDAGRAYYSALRKDKALTIYDEQAITNDLSTMSDHTTHF